VPLSVRLSRSTRTRAPSGLRVGTYYIYFETLLTERERVMRTDLTLVREPTDRTLPPSIFVRASRPPHRPVAHYDKLRVFSEGDARAVRRVNLPLYLLTSAEVSSLGYPIRFPSQLVVARLLLPKLETSLGIIPFSSEQAVREYRPEDTAVALLRFDRIGARALVERNADWDRNYLTRRIFEESLVERATFVRMSEILPGLPREGDEIPKDVLHRKLRKNR
jgi:hypothetical protein